MKVRLLKDVDTLGGKMPAGTIIEHADAFLLVTLGTAEPVEDTPPVDNQAAAETLPVAQ